MSQVEFETSTSYPSTQCIACKKTCDSQYLVKAANSTLRKCKFCQSFSVIDSSMINENYQNLSSDFWIDYVEMNAGIESMLSFVERCLPEKNVSSFIDVGCGFGFVVDYIQNNYGAYSVGLEKSLYGKVGAKKLNINIKPEYSGEFCAKNNDKFDVVYSSEVIEHVDDPLNFLIQLKELCSVNGRVIITTPNSKFINHNSDDAVLYAALSPGAHYFVISPEQLNHLMINAGFLNVKIVEINERILATASVESSTGTIINDSFERSKYIEYLMSLERNDDLIISNSATVKLYKEFINMGDYNSADPKWEKLNRHFIQYRGFDIDQFDESLLDGLHDLKDYTKLLPYYFGVLKFYRAMQLVNHCGRRSSMLHLFLTVTKILSKEVQLNFSSFQESNSLIENAKFHTALGILPFTERLLSDSEKFSKFWRERFNKEVLEQLRNLVDRNPV